MTELHFFGPKPSETMIVSERFFGTVWAGVDVATLRAQPGSCSAQAEWAGGWELGEHRAELVGQSAEQRRVGELDSRKLGPAQPAGPVLARWVLTHPWTIVDRAWAQISLSRIFLLAQL